MSYYTSSPITPARTLSETDLQELLLDPQEVDTLFKNVTPRIYCPSSPTATNTTSSPHSTDHFEDNHDNRVVIKDSELTCLHPDYLSYHLNETLTVKRKTSNVMNNDRLEIRILGVPDIGAKSRVETQIKLCIQLITNEKKVVDWSYIRLSESMLARSKLRRNQLQQKPLDGSITTMVSDESKILQLEAKVVCASNEDQPIRMCIGCVRRERKRAERTKDGKQKGNDPQPEALEAERDRILLFNCSPMINFSSGDAILPTRITCYCRHHNEKVGFRICFVMKNNQGTVVATGTSPPIMITDDHKSSKQRINRKRSREEQEPGCMLRLDTPASSRRGSIYSSDDNRPTALTTPTLLDDDIPLDNAVSNTQLQNAFFLPNAAFDLDTTNNDEMEAWPYNRRRRTIQGYTSTDITIDSLFDTFPSTPSTPIPQLERLVPAQGPTYGGIEVTLLGSGFYDGLTCLFGEHAVNTVFWNTSTLVCILPPAAQIGPVVVSFKEHPLVLGQHDVAIFTYLDTSDQALLELALQVVGLKMTGKLHDAKNVAMGIVQGGQNVQQDLIDALTANSTKYTLNLSLTNADGHTLLHLAVLLQNETLVKALLRTQEDTSLINIQDKIQMTALHYACQRNLIDIARCLLQAGANPSLENKWCMSFDERILDLLDVYVTKNGHIKRKPLSRRNSTVKSHMMHRFHSLSNTMTDEATAGAGAASRVTPSMESDGLGLVKQKIDRRLYLFWLPVLIVAVGLLFVQMFGEPSLLRPILEVLPLSERIPLSVS